MIRKQLSAFTCIYAKTKQQNNYEIFTIIPFTFNNVSAITALLDLLTNLNIFMLNSEIYSSDIINMTKNNINTAFNPYIVDTAFTNFLQIEAIGQGIYTFGASWLIMTSVILLLAMVAPIFISKTNSTK